MPSSTDSGMQPAPLPKVDKERLRWWRSRLHQYRSPVVFTWNALTFHDAQWLPGVAVWLGVNITIIVLSRMNRSIIQTAGEALSISAILYLLVHIGPRISRQHLFPAWVPEYEDRFQHICVHLTHAEWLVRKGIGNAKKIRKENPWKFYGVLLLVSFLLMEFGRWIPTALFIQLLACFVLLCPAILEYGLLSAKNQKQLTVFLKALAIQLDRNARALAVQLDRKVKDFLARYRENR